MQTPGPPAGDLVADYLKTPRQIASRTFADGSSVRLVALPGSSEFAVVHGFGPSEVELHRGVHSDAAVAVYEAFDGHRRGWHTVYGCPGDVWPSSGVLAAPVYAVGADLAGCVTGFLDRAGDTLREGSLVIGETPVKDDFQWEASFASARCGCSFRAAGRKVPGGYVMTWWK